MSTIVDTFIAPPCYESIAILYQDEHLLLINKPAGLLSLSGKNPQNSTRCTIGWCNNFPAVPSFTVWILVLPG